MQRARAENYKLLLSKMTSYFLKTHLDQRKADLSRSLISKRFQPSPFLSPTFLPLVVVAVMFYWPLVPLISFLTTKVWGRLHLVLISVQVKVNNQRRWHMQGRKDAVNLWCPRLPLWSTSLVSTCYYQMTCFFFFHIKKSLQNSFFINM